VPLILLILFFFSGLASLIYEVTWLKLLAGLLSNSSHALSLVLSGYLLGLALGSRESGRHGHLVVRPIGAYALLEGCIALVAVAVPFLLRAICQWPLRFLDPEAAHALRMFLCGLVLMGGSFFVGATFPLQIRAFAPAPSLALRAAAFILAFQTAGGMIGVLLSGFIFLPRLGIAVTQWIAVSITSLVAAACWVLSRGEQKREAERPLPEIGGIATFDRLRFRILVISVGVVGGVSLALEVLYTRILAFFLPDVAYSFSAVLAVYLLALAVGSLIAVWILRRVSSLAGAGTLAVLAGTVVIASLLVVPHLYSLLHRFEVSGGGFERGAFLAGALVVSSVLIMAPAALLASYLPVGIGLLAPGHGSAPSAAAAFSANSIGSASGALLAGMIFIACAGVKGSVLIAGLLVVACGLMLCFFDRARMGKLSFWSVGTGLLLPLMLLLWKPLALLWPLSLVVLQRRVAFSAKLAGLVGCCLCVPLLCRWAEPRRPLIRDSGVFLREGDVYQSGKLLDWREGTVASASVVERSGEKLLFTDAFQAAGTGKVYRYMKMLGHLPMLLQERARRALVIAFGTGTTCGSISLHPSLEHLTIVEISPEVLELAPHFAEVNRGLPKARPPIAELRVEVDDGRAFLRRCRETFDVISLEPLLPSTPAAYHFYTEEFFALAKSRLADGGVLCHWIPIHAQPVASLCSILKTFTGIFPDSDAFLFGSSCVLLGWNGHRSRLREEELLRRFEIEEVARDLRSAGLSRLPEVFGCFVASARTMIPACAGAPKVTDDHPRILYDQIRPYLERRRYHEEAVRFLYSVAEQEPQGLEALGPELVGKIRKSRLAKEWLRKAEALLEGASYRFRIEQGEQASDLALEALLREGQQRYRELIEKARAADPEDGELLELGSP